MFLEKLGVVHADIKLPNMVLFAEGARVKIIDFGKSFFVPPGTDRMHSRYFSCEAQPPPECEHGEVYLGRTDLWALVWAVWNLLMPLCPFLYDADGRLSMCSLITTDNPLVE